MSKEPRDIFVGDAFQEDRWHVTSRDADDQLFSYSLDERQPSPACPFNPTKMKITRLDSFASTLIILLV